MKVAKNNTGLLESKLARFLLVYRSTPNTTTGESPAESLFYHPIRTRLSLITPNFSTMIANKHADQKSYHDQ